MRAKTGTSSETTFWFNTDICLKEKEWRKSVETAIKGRDHQIVTLKQQVIDLQKQLDNTLQLLLSKERELTNIETAFRDIKMSFENEKSKAENLIKCLQSEMMNKIKEKEHEIEELKKEFLKTQSEIRERHVTAIHQLTKESRQQVECLETELEQAKNGEKAIKNEVKTIIKIIEEKDGAIQSKENKMIALENDLKELQLKLSKSYNNEAKCIQKLKDNETLLTDLQNSYKKLENDKKEMKIDMIDKIDEINKTVKYRTNKTEDIHNELLHINKIFTNIDKENCFMKNILIKLANDKKINSESIGIQVKINLTEICFEDTIIVLKKKISDSMEKEIKLSSELQNCKMILENTLKQNHMLKEVIKSMKKEKEEFIKEKQIQEDESRIKRLEDYVHTLKAKMTHENCGDGIWMVLNEMKEDLKGLKGKSWHRVTKVDPIQDATTLGGSSSQFSVPNVFSCTENKNLPLFVPKVDDSGARNRSRKVCINSATLPDNSHN
ncbi:uncharacterized protein LOC142326971 [Lycorma delicatula]|uniref:uncharacterized protein LOC142326971 n=1 Tax=Lycorma delicatula TaxID=130591 RepID=UPI003F511717